MMAVSQGMHMQAVHEQPGPTPGQCWPPGRWPALNMPR